MERLTIRNAKVRGRDTQTMLNHRVENGVDIYVSDSQILDKLADYEDAEEQGQLIIFPCKIGDAIYWSDGNGVVDGFSYNGSLWLNVCYMENNEEMQMIIPSTSIGHEYSDNPKQVITTGYSSDENACYLFCEQGSFHG